MKPELKFTAEKNCDLVPALREYVKSQGVSESVLLNSDVYFNGMPLESKYWEQTRINAGDKIEIFPNIYVITSAIVASVIGVAASSFTAIAVAAVANFVIGMAVSFVLNWAISKLFPTEKPQAPRAAPDTQALPTISGANNQYRPYEAAPLIIGTTRTSPDFAVPYYSIVSNGAQKIRHLFCVSAGAVDVWDIRKDDTSIEGLSITHKIYSGWAGEDLLYFDYSPSVTQQDFSLRDKAVFIAESPVNVRQMGIVVSFPQGLRSENVSGGSGTGTQYASGINLHIKLTDDAGNVSNTTRTINGKSYKSSWMGYVNITLPKTSKWKLEVYGWYPYKNKTMNNYKDGSMYRYIEGSIIELQWFRNEPAVKYSGKSMTLIEMEAVATDKLTGGLNTINCMARLKGMKADGSLVSSSNPALQTRRILKDKNIINNTEYVSIDDASFSAFETHCNKYGITVNGLENEGRRTGEVLSDMLEIGQGYINNASGVYSIVFDNPSNPVVDKIHSRNSWGMTIAHSFNILPVDGLRVNFNNKDKDYQVDERIVTETGVSPKNIQQLSNKFIDNSTLAYKYGMLNLAMDRLRKAIYTFNTDWRSIDYLLGQKIQISHPSFFLGVGTAGKVVDYVRNAQNMYIAVVLDQFYPTTVGVQYILQSSNKYSMQYWDIKAIDNENTNTLHFVVPITNVNTLPALGNLYTFGETEKAGVDVLIRNITRNADFTAEVECAPATDIYAALTGAIPEFESSLSFPTLWQGAKPNAPKIVKVNFNLEAASASGVGMASEATIEISYVEKDNVEFSHYIIGIRVTTDEGIEPDLPVLDEEGEVVENDISIEYDFYTGYDKSTFVLSGVFNRLDYEITIKAVSIRGLESDTTTYYYTPSNEFFEIPEVSGFKAEIVQPDGVRFSWGKTVGYEPVIYRVTGDINFETVELTYLSKDLSGKTGNLVFNIEARDVLGRTSEDTAPVSITVEEPTSPQVSHKIKTDGLFLTWSDATKTWPIRHYKVVDMFMGKTHLLNDEQLDVSERPHGTYGFTVQAVDIYDNISAVIAYDLEIEPITPPAPSMSIVGGVLRVSWNDVLSAFPIAVYEIATMDEIVLHSTKSTYYDVPPDAENYSGVISLKVRAKDTVGNVSEYSIFSEQITRPEAPQVTVSVHDDRRQVVVSWVPAKSEAPVAIYEVSAQYSTGGVLKEVEFGTFDVTTVFLEALSANVDGQMYAIHVRAINYLGMSGEIGETVLNVQKLSKPLHLTKSVTDNNVFLSWQAPETGSYAVKEYRVLRQQGTATQRNELFEEIGVIDSQFFGRFESKAGEYTYKIIPIDWAGVEGEGAVVVAYVDQPPDYNVYYDVDSTFNGDKVNFVLDGNGGMLGAVVDGETWQQNVDRIGLGDGLTWQQKNEAGAEYYLSPFASTATYTEVVNVNTFIATGRIQVTPVYDIIEGVADVSLNIEVSTDGIDYALVSEGSWETYQTGFQYIRFTVTVTNGIVRFTELGYKVDIKLKKDNGTVFYDAAKGMEGVWVPFKTSFIDVQGHPLVSVPSTSFENPLSAYTIFQDVPYPQGFHVFVLDKNGTPTSAEVTWLANGV